VGGFARARMGSTAGAPVIRKPAPKVRTVRARASGRRTKRGRCGLAEGASFGVGGGVAEVLGSDAGRDC
jgi:hypothetical protein